MAWLTSIFTFFTLVIKYLPTIIEGVKLIVKMIQDAGDAIDRAQKAKELKEAVKEARETKDTSKLEGAFGIMVERPEPEVVQEVVSVQSGVGFELRSVGLLEEPAKEEKKTLTLDLSGPTQASLFSRMKEKASSMSFGIMSSISGTITPDVDPGDPLVYNVNHVGGNSRRMSSQLIGPLAIAFLFTLGSCAKPAPNQPTYQPKLYAGDSERGGVTRKQSQEFISARDDKFNDYVALSYDDLSCVVQTYVNNCKEYKQQVVKCQKMSSGDKRVLQKAIWTAP